MDCKKAKNLMPEYLDQGLSSEDQKLLDKHLAGCHECRRELEVLRSSWELLSEYKAPVVDNNFTSKVVFRIQQKKDEVSKQTLWQKLIAGITFNRAVAIPAFASLLILLGAGVIYLKTTPAAIDATGISTSEKIELVRNVKDEEIIRDLEIYENADVLENLDLLMDLEAVETLEEEK